MKRLGLIWIPLLILGWATSASASHIATVTVGMMGNTTEIGDADISCSFSGSVENCSLDGPVSGTNWMLSALNLQLNPDPFVQNFAAITNTSGVTQNYIIKVVLPISPAFGPPSLIQGSIGGSLTDANGSGSATIGLVGANPLYAALIDGAQVRALNAALPTTVTGSFNTVTLGPDKFGIPIFESVNVATTTNIAITLRFSLTAGDTASFTSVFNVIPVPEPASAAMLGFGLLGLIGLTRRYAR